MKQIIETSKTVEQVFEDFKNSHFENLGAIPFCSSYIYLDNGEGLTSYVPFSIEAKNNQVVISMLIKDIPNYWRWQSDRIFEDAIDKVQVVLED